ncbi:branched-chain amino acid transaminase [Candidatus Villigracilis saccharophilus]|uniref:branched-chain amino acid transaminase n=1 Tax=Candidatus Villigracilis saccharophilus TaxID=3140684 RepID=UPI0031354E06|nr:branched-chain amino acid transaminase [Anaerolineales bacterium]
MAIPKTEWIWHNGQFVKWDDANVHITTHALHYGSSVFEGLRSYAAKAGPAILGLDPHVQRLFDSCRVLRMDLPYTQDQISSAIIETVLRNGLNACYIRPLAYKGTGTITLDARKAQTEFAIMAFDFGSLMGADGLENGVDVMVSSWRRMAPDTHAGMTKAGGNYVNSGFVTMEANDLGYMEGITLDVNGHVSEGSGENIFAVYRGAIYTPPVGASILLGVNRSYIIALAREMGYEVREETFPREMLYVADELFFTGTAVEVTPIRSVDRIKIGNGSCGPITKRIQDQFFGIINGAIPDTHGWMTLVK